MLEKLASIFVLYFSSNQHKVDIIRFTTNYNIASKFVKSNLIARACFIFLLCTLMTSANKSVEKKKIENVIKQLVHTSAVRSSRYEALGRFGYASSNSYASFVLSKLLACFISRWTHADVWTNCLQHVIHFNWFCKEHWSLSIKRCLHRSEKFLSGSFNTTLYSAHVIT